MLSRTSSDGGASGPVSQTPLGLSGGQGREEEAGPVGRAPGQRGLPPSPISALLGFMRKQDSLSKRAWVSFLWSSLVAQLVKDLPAMQETSGFLQYTYWTRKNCL